MFRTEWPWATWSSRSAEGVTAFYDIDTPVTLARVASGLDYLQARQIPRYDIYLSFTGGPTLDRLRAQFGARRARPLYCSVDPSLYYPEAADGHRRWDLGYMGTYSDDRQPVLERLMLKAARSRSDGRFVVAGSQYPDAIRWPANVDRYLHLAPLGHRRFYNRLRFALNITRREMVRAGHSPSVRLFEAAACGTPVISDFWPGLDRFFIPGVEILLSRRASDTLMYLYGLADEERAQIGRRARDRVLRCHTATHRAIELEGYVAEAGHSAGRSTVDNASCDHAAETQP